MTIDRTIEIKHERTKAHFASGDKSVSDLYLWKHYRALVLENERLQRLEQEADYDATIADFEAGYGRL